MFTPIRLFAVSLLALLGVTFAEKLIFVLYNGPLRAGIPPLRLAEALLWGLRFDLAVVGGLCLLVTTVALLLFRLTRLPLSRAVQYTTFVAVAVLIVIHGADLLYYQEAGRHLGYELKEAYNSRSALTSSAFGIYRGPVLFQLALVLPLALAGTFWLFRRLGGEARPITGWYRFVVPEGQWFLAVLGCVVLMRGGLQLVPLEPLHAQQVGGPRLAAIALNGAYNALFSSLTPYSVERAMRSRPTPQDIAQVEGLYPAAVHPLEPKRPLNVVVVVAESWSAGYMSSYGYNLPTTPNYTRLRAASLTTTYGMIADGHRTTEGMFATFCSAQNPLGATVAQTQLQNYDYECLPKLLRKQGYHTAFFQGTLRNTSGTGAFATLIGFEDSYGKEDMPPPRFEQNSWGRQDPDVYDFVLSRMRAMKSPFLIGINSNSTHDRVLPPNVKAPFHGHGDVDGYLNVLHFADQSLWDFVQAVRSDPTLKDNTVFFLLADHTGTTPASPFYHHFIPFSLYAPGIVAAGQLNRIASQRDIAPTVLDLLGLETPHWFAGKSLLRSDQGPYFADFFEGGELGWLENDQLALVPIEFPDKAQCYNYVADPFLRQATACDGQGRALGQQGLAFSRVFQELLFTGKLTRFDRGRAGLAGQSTESTTTKGDS